MVNNQGNPICSCQEGFIPRGSPVDGCIAPRQFPSSPVILHNRLGGGPGHLSVGPRASDPCSPSPCGPGTPSLAVSPSVSLTQTAGWDLCAEQTGVPRNL